MRILFLLFLFLPNLVFSQESPSCMNVYSCGGVERTADECRVNSTGTGLDAAFIEAPNNPSITCCYLTRNGELAGLNFCCSTTPVDCICPDGFAEVNGQCFPVDPPPEETGSGEEEEEAPGETVPLNCVGVYDNVTGQIIYSDPRCESNGDGGTGPDDTGTGESGGSGDTGSGTGESSGSDDTGSGGTGSTGETGTGTSGESGGTSGGSDGGSDSGSGGGSGGSGGGDSGTVTVGGSDTGGTGEGSDDSGSASGTGASNVCGSPPVCSTDDAECQNVIQTYFLLCPNVSEFDLDSGLPDGFENVTFQSVLDNFISRVSDTPIISGISSFFSINVSGSCPVYTANVFSFTLVVDQFCSDVIPWGIISGIIIAVASFFAFRIAFT